MIYRWKLTINGVTTDVHPVYKDDLALNYELESGQRFFRAKLSSKVDFIGADAELIINAGFTTEFVVVIECSTDYGLNWSTLHRAHFYKTDCTINLDDRKVTVQPQVLDQYNEILNAWEKEYNLIDLLPVTERVTLKKRALLQLYADDGKITNVFGGFSWEEDFDIGSADIVNDLHFKSNMSICVIKFVRVFAAAGMTGLLKSFIAQPDANGEFEVTNGEGVYKLKRVKLAEDSYDLRLIRLSDSVQVAHYWTPFIVLNDALNFVDSGDIAWGAAECEYQGVYARWLCDVQSFTIGGQTYTTTALTSDDPSYGGNLHYVIEADVTIIPSNNLSENPTKWGKFDSTHYYDRPSESGYFIPVAHSYWSTASIWYKQQSSEYNTWEPAMQKPYELKDSYPLWSVISVLLSANNTGLTFQPSTTYSAFLYSAVNPVYGYATGVPHITPKSNVLVGEYTQPSMKAPITLSDVLDMLKKAYDCYWFVDGDNHLRVEHISWFKNGGAYSNVHQVGVDLTAMIQTRNGKPWSFGTNAWQFDKIDMPARYQYKWMDAGTDVFDGFPYEIQSPFVQTDKVEEINISNFTSDIDYMQIAPENCSKDGFALLMVMNDGSNYVPIVSVNRTKDGGTCYYKSQNFYASLMFLQEFFLCYDLPSKAYVWDGLLKTSRGIKRGRQQKVTVPFEDNAPDVTKLVHTAMGDGEVQQLSLNLSSRSGKLTLKYDTY